MKPWILLLCVVPLIAEASLCVVKRDPAQIHLFRVTHPCPATGHLRGACPGWQVDHIKALECCGSDAPDNMQWLSLKAHQSKSRLDNKQCKAKRG